jgi:hypothetical protein
VKHREAGWAPAVYSAEGNVFWFGGDPLPLHEDHAEVGGRVLSPEEAVKAQAEEGAALGALRRLREAQLSEDLPAAAQAACVADALLASPDFGRGLGRALADCYEACAASWCAAWWGGPEDTDPVSLARVLAAAARREKAGRRVMAEMTVLSWPGTAPRKGGQDG